MRCLSCVLSGEAPHGEDVSFSNGAQSSALSTESCNYYLIPNTQYPTPNIRFFPSKKRNKSTPTLFFPCNQVDSTGELTQLFFQTEKLRDVPYFTSAARMASETSL